MHWLCLTYLITIFELSAPFFKDKKFLPVIDYLSLVRIFDRRYTVREQYTSNISKQYS